MNVYYIDIVRYYYGGVGVVEARENIIRLYYPLLYRVILQAAFKTKKTYKRIHTLVTDLMDRLFTFAD